jgi:hypothetical protein
LPETADHNVTQTINDESVWARRKFVAFVHSDQELYDEMTEEEISPFDISTKKDGKGNTACVSKVLGVNRDDVIELNECDKADEFKSKKRKEDQVDYVHQENKWGESLDCD